MSRIASLAMYDMPWLVGANDALWAAIARRLRASGLEDGPARLERQRALMEVWRDPDLLLAQTCGYPLMTALAGQVTPIAAPIYAWPGCSGARHCSLIVVAQGAPFETLADLRGRRVAMNGADSNSGMNLLRHAVAGLAEGGRFFGKVVVTGSHLASLDHVGRGEADVAAIDCVSFGLAARHRPALVAGLRVIGETATSPALPFVTRAGASTQEVAALRRALAGAIADPDAAEAVAALGLIGIEPVETSDYAVVLDYEREAVAAGYPTLR
ncbi:PhnD/SsuA/transferrin family substrate-binding protein [Aurantimonas sp. 22II-16-19i]|uniref:phosphate/phosphite/phosphonate ABC transporter substrate-binding protein n=1 Tax=Aurantimonas sp. 22II-16-19i TaxID=1317114 RepID=UPI0009F7E17A|nr:PhnD/SsuA/transferrin family substrate-binding protein [Aurantimonas sp. 22II-16-19i]ORE90464.1 putative ABC phosphate/phosphonate transporter, periplasmic ligand binding protein [Aurantimonas sp. 22II-16-19i]